MLFDGSLIFSFQMSMNAQKEQANAKSLRLAKTLLAAFFA